MGADFNKKAYQKIYRHSAWEQTADKYEEEFAARLYKTPYVQQAAKTALTRLSRMLNAYYKNPDQAPGMNEEAVENAQALGQVAAEMTGEAAPGTNLEAGTTGPQAQEAETGTNLTEAGEPEAQQDNVEITDTLLEALLPKGDKIGRAHV